MGRGPNVASNAFQHLQVDKNAEMCFRQRVNTGPAAMGSMRKMLILNVTACKRVQIATQHTSINLKMSIRGPL